MKKMYWRVVFLLILTFFIFGIGTAEAGVLYKNNTIKTSYVLGEKINGKFNVSFNNQKSDSLLTSNFNGSIKLLDFLEKNNLTEGIQFNCSVAGCGKGYRSIGEISSFELNGVKTVGFKAVGENIDSVSSARIKVQSNSENSCSSPLTIKILGESADEEDVIINDKYTSETCGERNYGCFDISLSSNSYGETYVSNTLLCNNITLFPAPAYKVGAKIKNKTRGNIVEMRMRLLDSRGEQLGEDCILPAYPNSSTETELECIINHTSSKREDYFVCVMADANLDDILSEEPNTANYKIRTEQSGNKCGVNEAGSKTGRDYELFARAMQFGAVDLTIDETFFEDKFGISLKSYLEEYLFDSYPESDSIRVKCEPECVIPIEFNGTGIVSLSNIQFAYKDSGIGAVDSKIYDLESRDSELNSGYLNLELERAGFTVQKDDDKFRLYLDGVQVFEQPINVEAGFDFEISPKFILVGRNTEFTATSGRNITYTKWEFGDGESAESNSRKARHSYIESGEYELLVEAKLGNLTSKKIFAIKVGNAKDSANLTIKDYKIRIGNLSSQINSYPQWQKTEIEKVINIAELNASLAQLERDFKKAENDSEYEDIVAELIELDVPYSIMKSESGRLPLSVGFNEIDVSIVETISNKDIDDEELQLSIIDWMDRNYDSDIDYEVVTALGEAESNDIYTKFKISLNPKTETVAGDLIINYPLDEIVFLEQSGARSIGGATAIPVSGSKTIEFLVRERIAVEELGAYVSPDISAFSIDEREICEGSDCPQPEFPWTIFWIAIGILFIVMLIIYIILQEWYKRNYERHLFRNGDELYNMINFIYNGRHSGLPDGQIRGKLRESGWGGEQINYAFRKIDGKRTGMFEIPLFKSGENRKIREEIARRHGGQVDARFIKRPEF